LIPGPRGHCRSRPLVSLVLLVPFLGFPCLGVGRAGTLSGQATEPPPREAIERALHDLGPSPDDAFDALRRAYHLSVQDPDHLVVAQAALDGVASSAVGSGEPTPSGRSQLAEAAEPLLMAYRGALEVVRARHARWPMTRLAHLRAGTADLDRAVAVAPSHMEVRYLRLVSETHLPWPFRRDAIVAGDREVLRRALADGVHGLSPEMASFVAGVLDTVPPP